MTTDQQIHMTSHWFPIKVLYLVGHDAEKNLSDPIIKRLKEDGSFEVETWDTRQQCDGNPDFFSLVDLVDIVISPCDRTEMLSPTISAFLHNKPIVRIYAGINTSG